MARAVVPLRSFFLFSFALSLSSAMTMHTTANLNRCAVFGVGVLGTSLCQQLLEASEDSIVTGITKTSNRHESIREQIGEHYADRFHLITAEEFADSDEKFQNVVFCVPPSGFEDYPAGVKEATEKYWAGPSAGGVFAFTSSGAVYGPGDTGTVTETSPYADTSSSLRVARLVNAEKACLEAGGCCLRLAGLYNLQRGAHNYWMTSGKSVASAPDGMINMLHYEDAASACVAALKAGPAVSSGKAFLISDGNPLSRYDICENALKAAVYSGYSMPEFTGSDNQPTMALGKIYDGSVSNDALQWSPKYKSFVNTMESNA